MKIRTRSITLAAVMLVVGNCFAVAATNIVEGTNSFGCNVFGTLSSHANGKNLLISPTSIALALGMTYNGAGGKTAAAMAKTLGVSRMKAADVNAGYKALMDQLEKADPYVQVNIANSLWVNQGEKLKPGFVSESERYYDAKVTTLNFSDPRAANVINSWVKSKTEGKIPKLVDRVSKDDTMFLINATYFKGPWKQAFDPKNTKNGPFYLGNGSRISHPMMHQNDVYQHYKGSGVEAVSLPFGRERMSMYVFVPDKGTELGSFLKTLNAKNWNSWMSRFSEARGEVVIPRFKFNYSIMLNDPLKALGMGVAFTPAADFSRMISGPAWISYVKHDSMVNVNEKGAEAAAATIVAMTKGVRIPPDNRPFKLVADRPFFFAIRDNTSGAVLFMGTVADPR